MKGTIKFINKEKKFGFIKAENGQDVHFNINHIFGAENAKVNDVVDFEINEYYITINSSRETAYGAIGLGPICNLNEKKGWLRLSPVSDFIYIVDDIDGEIRGIITRPSGHTRPGNVGRFLPYNVPHVEGEIIVSKNGDKYRVKKEYDYHTHTGWYYTINETIEEEAQRLLEEKEARKRAEKERVLQLIERTKQKMAEDAIIETASAVKIKEILAKVKLAKFENIYIAQDYDGYDSEVYALADKKATRVAEIDEYGNVFGSIPEDAIVIHTGCGYINYDNIDDELVYQIVMKFIKRIFKEHFENSFNN